MSDHFLPIRYSPFLLDRSGQFLAIAAEQLNVEFDVVTEDFRVDMFVDGMGAPGSAVVEDAGKAVDTVRGRKVTVIA